MATKPHWRATVHARVFHTVSLICLGASGCTHLAVTPERIATEPARNALSGATYSLPMLQYDVLATRTLAGCPESISLGAGSDNEFWSDALKVDLTATAAPNYIPGERYNINYSKLDSWLKTTDFTIEYQPDSDQLKSINVSVEDHTGEVVADVIKAGLAAVAVASGPAGLGAAIAASATMAIKVPTGTQQADQLVKGLGHLHPVARPAPRYRTVYVPDPRYQLKQELASLVRSASDLRPILACKATTVAELKKRSDAAGALKEAQAKLPKLTAEIDQFTKLAGVKALNKSRRDELSAKAVALLALTKLIDDKKAEIAKLDKTLAISGKESWPQSFAARSHDGIAATPNDEMNRFAGLLEVTPRKVWVIRPADLAKALAENDRYKRFEPVAAQFVERFIDKNGQERSFTAPPVLAGCTDAISAANCVKSMTTIRIALQPVRSDFLPECGVAQEQMWPTKDCLARYESAQKWAEDRAQKERASGKHVETGLIPDRIDARDGAVRSGVFVRPPARASLLICRAPSAIEKPNDLGCAAGGENLVKDDKIVAPQLGQLRYFRLVNQAFSNNTLTLSLTKAGYIEKFRYASTKSVGQGLAAAAADAATQASAFDKARRAEYEANTDPTKQLQKQIDLLTAQQKLAALNAPSSGPSASDIAQLAKVNAEIDYLKAQKTYLDAQTAVYQSTALNP